MISYKQKLNRPVIEAKDRHKIYILIDYKAWEEKPFEVTFVIDVDISKL